MTQKLNIFLFSLLMVPLGGDFQAALDRAVPGDEIVLASNATFVGSFTLPKKMEGAPIIIRSEGAMAKVLSPGRNLPALSSAPGASNYVIRNVEFGKATPEARVTNLILLGNGTETSLVDLPSRITLDNVYVHGEPNSDLRRCIALNGIDLKVINSRITECHEKGADSQGIAGWNGPGPFLIENNVIEAASENILFGGADPAIPGLVPSDIIVRGNTVRKLPEWRGQGWVVKNLFQTKNARRVLVENNLFENTWTDGQTGTAIVVKSANQDGRCPWCVSEDITFRNNVIKNAEEGVRINAAEGNPLPPKVNNVRFEGDRFENISGKLFQIFGGATNVTIDRVQGQSGTGILFSDTAPNPGLVVKNSTFINKLYGVGAGAEEGQPYLDKWFPGAIFENNTIRKEGELPPAISQVALPLPAITLPTPVVPPVPVPDIIKRQAPATTSPLDTEISKLMDWLKQKLIQNGK